MNQRSNPGQLASLVLATLFGCVVLTGCGVRDGKDADSTGDDRLYVVATTTMVADAAARIGGEHIRLNPLMKPGVDPHLYEPTPKDGIALREADLVLYNGHFLEGQMEKALQALGKKSYAVAEAIPERELLQDVESSHADPHVWGDVELWIQSLEVVGEALATTDKDNAEVYRIRTQEAVAELKELDVWVKGRISEIPEAQRILITSHDAFGYFGEAYGLQVLGLQGISTVGEVGLAERVAMVDFIKDKGVKAIFVESSVNPAVIESVSQDAGVRIGGELFSDALGQGGQMEEMNGESYDVGTYIGMIKHNVNAVVEALK
ncbi:MAG: zinc ABC transporter substrate-binding protein [Verrucomicrobiota bacterium]